MELYVAALGIKKHIDEWESDLRAVKLPYRDKRGDEKSLVKLGVCDVKLKKIFFPEEHLDTVMSLVGVRPGGGHILKRHPMIRRGIAIMRKALGLKKAPEPKKNMEHMMPKYVAVVPLGTKNDAYSDDGIELI